MSVANIRQSYEKGELLEAQASTNPLEQFNLWLNEALEQSVPEPTAMTLSTVGADHRPSSRIVLLKGIQENGFVFFTNYASHKGQELTINPWACLLFFWQPLERQIRIEGQVTKVAPAVSDTYYQSRPLGSRLGAWASNQSQPTELDALQARFKDVTEQYGNNPPRPDHWGGYRLEPTLFEFWQGRPSRLHDRLQYTKNDAGIWTRQRLAP